VQQLLALVDEVAVDTVTRGALKDDATFKGLRDVIKKCNRVLEDMLVRRERKYTLFFRLVQPHDTSDIGRMKAWNDKVEKAVGSVTGGRAAFETGTDSESDTDSTASGSSDASNRSGGLISRGRQLLPTAGKVRSRRATPTPKMRRRGRGGDDSEGDASGYCAVGSQTATRFRGLTKWSSFKGKFFGASRSQSHGTKGRTRGCHSRFESRESPKSRRIHSKVCLFLRLLPGSI
jgi:hypothetical protein